MNVCENVLIAERKEKQGAHTRGLNERVLYSGKIINNEEFAKGKATFVRKLLFGFFTLIILLPSVHKAL